MKTFRDKRIKVLIISPQNWGKMRISKHHYAIELAHLGYQVFYLEPLVASWKTSKRRIESRKSDHENLKLISHEINFPYNLKFHCPLIYRVLMQKHVKKLERQLGHFDIIWSFDIANSIPLSHFNRKSKKIFFAADWPPNEKAKSACYGADLIVSVAKEILDQYPSQPNSKKLLVSHGVSEPFVNASKKPFQPQSNRINIGLSGNFLRPDINRHALKTIVTEHPELHFNFFGAYKSNKSNIGGDEDVETTHYIASLKQRTNTQFHGIISQNDLATRLREMDAFLICYDKSKDQSKGTNYHKISEYLVYNRPIISNEVSAHKSNPLVIQEKNKLGVVDVVANFKSFIETYSCYDVFSSSTNPKSYQELLETILNQFSLRNS